MVDVPQMLPLQEIACRSAPAAVYGRSTLLRRQLAQAHLHFLPADGGGAQLFNDQAAGNIAEGRGLPKAGPGHQGGGENGDHRISGA